MTKIIIWNEFIHEIENEEVKSIYPDGIHHCIKDFLSNDETLKRHVSKNGYAAGKPATDEIWHPFLR